MAHRDRKIQKKRGTRNCGWGNTQKHRGAGSRGGRGNAGSKKQKWSYTSKYLPDYFGRKGFKRPEKVITEDVTINVGDLSKNIKKYVSEGKAVENAGKYIIDLTALGYNKLLGSGKATEAIEIKVAKSTQSAIEKIQKAGGKVELLKQEA